MLKVQNVPPFQVYKGVGIEVAVWVHATLYFVGCGKYPGPSGAQGEYLPAGGSSASNSN